MLRENFIMKYYLLVIALFLSACSTPTKPDRLLVGGFSYHSPKDSGRYYDEVNPAIGVGYGKWNAVVFDNTRKYSSTSYMLKREIGRYNFTKHLNTSVDFGAVYYDSGEDDRYRRQLKPLGSLNVRYKVGRIATVLSYLPTKIDRIKSLYTLTWEIDL